MSLRYKIKKLAEAAPVDLRSYEIVDDGITKIWSQGLDKKEIGYRISAMRDGKRIAFLSYIQMENMPGSVISDKYKGKTIAKCIYFDVIDVMFRYRDTGIATELLKNFGQIYQSKFAGWPVVIFYMNPVAEYAYRKAVSLGYIPENTLDEAWIERDEEIYPQKEQLIRDLRGKLPENVQGPEVWAHRKDYRMIVAAEEDLSDYTIEVERFSGNFIGSARYTLTFIMYNENLGNLVFETIPHEQTLDIMGISVDTSFRQKGIATLLYKKFGEIYKEDFSGWTVKRFFVNPVAEYAFRKAVSMGWVPQEALNEDSIKRLYNAEETEQFRDLRRKLPIDYRGTFASRKDLRKVVANHIKDLRIFLMV